MHKKSSIIREILSTLSDTELTAITFELNNPNISNGHIFNQLFAKANEDYTPDNSVRSKLPTTEDLVCEVASELANRLLDRDKMVGSLR